MFSATPTVYFALHFACWAPERFTTLSRMIYRGGSEDEVPTLSQQTGICRDHTLCFRWGTHTHTHTRVMHWDFIHCSSSDTAAEPQTLFSVETPQK